MPRPRVHPDAGTAHPGSTDPDPMAAFLKGAPKTPRGSRRRRPDAGTPSPDPATPDTEPKAKKDEPTETTPAITPERAFMDKAAKGPTPKERAEQADKNISEVLKPFSQDLALYKEQPELLRARGKDLLQFVFAVRGLTKSGTPEDIFMGRKALAASEALLSTYQSTLIEMGAEHLNPAKDFTHDSARASEIVKAVREGIPDGFSRSGFWKSTPFEEPGMPNLKPVAKKPTPTPVAKRSRTKTKPKQKRGVQHPPQQVTTTQTRTQNITEIERLGADKIDLLQEDGAEPPVKNLDDIPYSVPPETEDARDDWVIDEADTGEAPRKRIDLEEEGFDIDALMAHGSKLSDEELLSDRDLFDVAERADAKSKKDYYPILPETPVYTGTPHEQAAAKALRHQEERRRERDRLRGSEKERAEILTTAQSSLREARKAATINPSAEDRTPVLSARKATKEKEKPGFSLFGWLGGLLKGKPKSGPAKRRMNLLDSKVNPNAVRPETSPGNELIEAPEEVEQGIMEAPEEAQLKKRPAHELFQGEPQSLAQEPETERKTA